MDNNKKIKDRLLALQLPNNLEPTPQFYKAKVEALEFAFTLDFDTIHLPTISSAVDGEINFWWDTHLIKLDLGFYGDETYSFYAIAHNGLEFYGDDLEYKKPLPYPILILLELKDET